MLFSQEAGSRLHKQPSEANRKIWGWARRVVYFWNEWRLKPGPITRLKSWNFY